MKTVTRILVLLLAIVMMASCFVACNNNNKTSNKKPSSNNENTELDYEMPDKVDLDDYIYRAYVRANVSTSDPTNDGNPSF